MAREIWKAIPGYEGFYEISTAGRIRNLQTKRFLKTKSNQPYYQVWLNKNGLREIKKVHQLVALTFLGEPPPGCVVNHIDLNKHNNCLTNLEYATSSQNAQHAAVNRAWKSSVSPEIEAKIRSESEAGESFVKLSQKYNLSYTHIRNICHQLKTVYSQSKSTNRAAKRKVKITAAKVRRIKSMWESGHYSQPEIAKVLGINVTTVCLICNDKYRVKHLGEI